jgi:hypothetical protein
METAAAAAPEAPAMSTVALFDVVAATPKIRPKIETVPSSIPNTMVPAELISELRSRCKVDAIVIVRPLYSGRRAHRFGRLDVPPGRGKLLYHQLLGLWRAARLGTVFRQHVF